MQFGGPPIYTKYPYATQILPSWRFQAISAQSGADKLLCGIAANQSGYCWVRGMRTVLIQVAAPGWCMCMCMCRCMWLQRTMTSCCIAAGLAYLVQGYNPSWKKVLGSANAPVGAFIPTPSLVDGGHSWRSMSAAGFVCAVNTKDEAYCCECVLSMTREVCI